jgi:manganese/zinc/iron transport system permease protein
MSDILRVMSLADYNTRVVVLGAGLLGFAAGVVGSFALLRRRALLGDALAHATLPGIGLAFMIQVGLGGDGKSLPMLLLGAAGSGVLGTFAILAINRLPRMKEDVALGIVLSVFFGAGIVLLVVIQQMATGHAAGLESFIYGKTASMLERDAWLIGSAGAVVTLVAITLLKELKLLCFDASFAAAQGYNRSLLDLVLMSLIVIVTVIGLQAVGLILIIALLVIPAAAARFWTERMNWMIGIAALMGSLSAMVGAAMSALAPDLPSGATIVLVCGFLFLISLFFGTARGTFFHTLQRYRLRRRVGRQHLLRAMFEQLELGDQPTDSHRGTGVPIPIARLLGMRSWSMRQLQREVRRAAADGELVELPDLTVRFTSAGLINARRLAREHRLWELYLIHYAEIAPAKVDRDADMIEHVLQPSMIAELEQILESESVQGIPPSSPHPLGSDAALPKTFAQDTARGADAGNGGGV